MGRGGCGCLPWLLGLILLLAWLGEMQAPSLQVEQYDPRSPRRPLPRGGEEQYIIEDRPGGPADAMGTAFAVDRNGVWMTAEHVTHGCSRVGLEQRGRALEVPRVIESRESDAAIIPRGPRSPAALPLRSGAPSPGSTGYHMGFPAGEPTLVLSELIGRAEARRGSSGIDQPVLVWAERGRLPEGDGTLSGISGGPVFSTDGRVVGINSASTDRRGRILTVAPDAMMRLTAASRAVGDQPVAYPFAGLTDAQERFANWLDEGVIRRIFCDVDDGRGG
ncbi:MAG: trypsin-like peptidase domain-containing protein [Sphingobium yanoikuyae]|uniref:S1 family peptidase n=1 Tax=Sphingobium yanoikuyae TaxID=13690 RepID=UPI001B0D1313|nr:trypsin-like peptidase domain-containing protein [Sphingobium yanoikuyae]